MLLLCFAYLRLLSRASALQVIEGKDESGLQYSKAFGVVTSLGRYRTVIVNAK